MWLQVRYDDYIKMCVANLPTLLLITIDALMFPVLTLAQLLGRERQKQDECDGVQFQMKEATIGCQHWPFCQ